MKVALESGEVLDIALIEGERVIGTLSLQLKDLTSTSRAGRPAGVSARASASDGAGEGRKTRKRRKPMSDEARARMAAAQKARWEKKRSGRGSA